MTACARPCNGLNAPPKGHDAPSVVTPDRCRPSVCRQSLGNRQADKCERQGASDGRLPQYAITLDTDHCSVDVTDVPGAGRVSQEGPEHVGQLTG